VRSKILHKILKDFYQIKNKKKFPHTFNMAKSTSSKKTAKKSSVKKTSVKKTANSSSKKAAKTKAKANKIKKEISHKRPRSKDLLSPKLRQQVIRRLKATKTMCINKAFELALSNLDDAKKMKVKKAQDDKKNEDSIRRIETKFRYLSETISGFHQSVLDSSCTFLLDKSELNLVRKWARWGKVGPRNAYMKFSAEMRAQYKDRPLTESSRLIGELWRKLSDKEKEAYGWVKKSGSASKSTSKLNPIKAISLEEEGEEEGEEEVESTA